MVVGGSCVVHSLFIVVWFEVVWLVQCIVVDLWLSGSLACFNFGSSEVEQLWL